MNLRQLCLLLTLLWAAQLAASETGLLGGIDNYRVRTGTLIRGALGIAGHWKGLVPEDHSAKAQDDLGPALLLATILHLTHTREELAAASFSSPPRAYFLALALPYLFTLLAFAVALTRLHSLRLAAAFTLLLALSRLGAPFAFSGDVYGFPLLCLALMLLWLASLASKRIPWWLAGALTGGLLFGCHVFRSAGLLALGPALLVLVFPKLAAAGQNAKRARQGALLLVGTFALCLALLAPKARHPVWFSIHAGLFEFGGWVNPATSSAGPNGSPEPPGAQRVDRWQDEIQAMLIRKNFPHYAGVGDYKPEHEQLLKDEVLQFLREQPATAVKVIVLRLWRLSVPDPWPALDPASAIQIAEPFGLLLRLAFLATLVFALYRGLWRQSLFYWLVTLLPLGLPPLLVHSGYLMYNLAFTADLLLLWLLAGLFLLRKEMNA